MSAISPYRGNLRGSRHEAGHVVAAHLLGYAVREAKATDSRSVTVVPAMASDMPPKHRAMIAIAGEVGYRILSGIGKYPATFDTVSKSDMNVLRVAMEEDGYNTLLEAWWDEAWKLLASHKAKLRRVARFLHRYGYARETDLIVCTGITPWRRDE